MDSYNIAQELPKALINWYPFKTGARALWVSGGRQEFEVLFSVLQEKGLDTTYADPEELKGVSGEFDYIVAVSIIERSDRPDELLALLRGLLKGSGRLLLGAENRLGIRYFCGDKDLFSGHVLDGIDGYRMVSEKRKKINGGRAYAKAEYEKMLSCAGFSKCRFYAVMPELRRPQILLADNYIPNEPLAVRIFPQYKSPGSIFLEEEQLYGTLLENHMFHQMANGFLFETSLNGTLLDVDQITVQGDRGHEEALVTILKEQECVSKKALYPEGAHKINTMMESTEYLRQHGIPVVGAKIEGDAYVMPYVNGQIATEYFQEILRCDRQLFLHEINQFRDMIVASSEEVPYEDVNWLQFEPWWEKRKKDDPNIDQWQKRAFGSPEEKRNIGVILKRGYIDMVSLNCFHTGNGFVFFDQEFFIENFPANAIFIRSIDFIYRDRPDLEKVYAKEELLKRFHLYEYQDTWRRKGNEFLDKLRKETELAQYHRQYRRDARTIFANRYRMDYSQEEYERLFTDIFKGIGSKKIYLFGSGRYAVRFVEQFGQDFDIAGIIDNSEDRWGQRLSGIEIFPPNVLKGMEEPFKVFICIKFFEDVLVQLKDMGISNISVYDPDLEYERPMRIIQKNENQAPKKYHIGYVAGVFDLFHIGHLNILRRAKEQCDYLIVGIVSDEQVVRGKKTRPYIPFAERFALVQACRYVDEVVEIPVDRPGTEDAYYRYHFDVQFSGSDYENDPGWLAKRAFLRQHGSDLVFFPYTEGVSSTELKERVGKIGRSRR